MYFMASQPLEVGTTPILNEGSVMAVEIVIQNIKRALIEQFDVSRTLLWSSTAPIHTF